MERLFRHAVVAIVLVLCSNVTALAAVSVGATFNTLTPGGQGTTATLAGLGTFRTNQGGIFSWNQDPASGSYTPTALWNGGAPDSSSLSQFISVCIEAAQDISYSGHYNYSLTSDLAGSPVPGGLDGSPMGPAAASYIQELWYNHMGDVMAARFGANGSLYAGAFQLAVWKLVYDHGTTFDLTSGNLQAGNSSGDGLLAQQWLTELQAEGTDSPNKVTTLAVLQSMTNQDQLVNVGIPEPASFVIWGLLAVVGLAFRLRNI
jgi:hypothetical protein